MTTAVLRAIDDLRAPPALPVLGNALQLDIPRMHQVLEQWSEELGPVYRMRMGTKTAVVCTDAELMQVALRERPLHFRRFKAIEEVIQEMGSNGLFSVEGPAWRPQRQLIMKALASTHLPQFFPMLHGITGRLLARWDRAAQSGQVLDMCHELKLFTVDATTALVFGEDPNTIEETSDVIQDHLAEIFPMLMSRVNAAFPLWRYLRLPKDRRFDKALAAVRRHVQGLVARGRERLDARPGEPAANLLQAMLIAAREPGSGITDEIVSANVMTLLLAGEDTTANTLAWAIHYLALDPSRQTAMHAQAASAFAGERVCPSFEVLKALDAFEAVGTEATRLKPIAPILILEPIEDATLGDLAVPAGTPIFFLLRPAMLAAANFGRPLEFVPERWAAGHGEVQPHNARAYAQFGAGPRMCPGRALAGVEIRLVLSMLMRNFEVKHAVDPRSIKEVMAFAMMPDRMPVQLRAAR